MNNTFSWADLSTFDIHAAKSFYKQCLGWRYENLYDGYLSCSASGHPTAGLFTMPEFFQSINMPSFWMSYVQVSDLTHIVATAESLGAKVEIKSQAAPGGGNIALIRDPAGAGFTCYEGEALQGRDASASSGRLIWNELHVSNIESVEKFYTELFEWNIESTNIKDRYQIFSSSGSKPIAGIQVTSNELKGDKEYWGVYFAVDDLTNACKKIEENSGQLAAEQPLGTCPAVLAYDSQGAAFYIVDGATFLSRN